MATHVPITLSRKEKCSECEEEMLPDDKAIYEVGSHLTRTGRTVYCESCGKDKL